MGAFARAIKALAVCLAVWSFAFAAFALVPDDRLEFAWTSLLFELIGFACFAAWTLAFVALSLRARAWRSAVGCLTLGVALSIGAFASLPYREVPFDYLHFLAMQHRYDAALARAAPSGRRYAEFDWGGMLFASTGIAYDESDEIALPYGRQSRAWKARMKETDLTCGGNGPIAWVVPFGRHYYLATFGC